MGVMQATRNLGLGLWVGGLAAIDFVDAPARFKTPGLDRNAITAVGRSVFRAWGRYEIGVASVTTLAALAARKEGGRTAALVLPMWALTALQAAVLQPKMRALGEGLDFVNRDPDEPRYAAHRKYHGAYMAADGVKFLLGLAATAASGSGKQTNTTPVVADRD
jgi:Domain of unknown function (DUF4149)